MRKEGKERGKREKWQGKEERERERNRRGER